MTRTLYLHIGLGKTGSSTLQSWLSLNASALGEYGIHYADLAPSAKHGAITSGNGYPLWIALKDGDAAGAEGLLRDEYFGGDGSTRAIVSCEILQQMKKKHVLALKDLCRDLDMDIQVVAYVRSVYEHCYSIHGQGIKRAGFEHAFGEQDIDIEGWLGGTALALFSLHFPGRVTVLNYDDAGRDIFQAFSMATGIPPDIAAPLESRINRSLTPGEGEAMRECNARGGAPFCTAISDYLIERFPDRTPTVHYDAAVVDRVVTRYADEVAWVNQTFDLQPPLATHLPDGSSSELSPLDYGESLTAIADWALAYLPGDESMGDFAAFLSRFAKHPRFADSHHGRELQARAGVMTRTARMRQLASAASGDTPHRFLFAYLPADEARSAAAGPEHQRALGEWLADIGASAIGATLQLVGASARAGPPDATARDLTGATAYSVLELGSLDEALALARACPLLQVGGDIWVFELQPMADQ